jgi:uncharacterized Zn finger protein
MTPVPPRRFTGAFPAYLTAAERRARAAAAARGLQQSGGARKLEPITVSGRALVQSFWAQAWCKNLESYADFAHRLARGRSYARTGAVIDLQIAAGRIEARVSGTRLYTVEIGIAPLAASRWEKLARACTGRIGSLVALLRGQLPDEVMQAVTDRDGGLFPEPRQLDISCSCPDWATVCKHVAATLYGVGVRFDSRPELLFVLRGVDPADLLEQASRGLAQPPGAGAATLAGSTEDLAALFGIDLVDVLPPPAARKKRKPAPARRRRRWSHRRRAQSSRSLGSTRRRARCAL